MAVLLSSRLGANVVLCYVYDNIQTIMGAVEDILDATQNTRRLM